MIDRSALGAVGAPFVLDVERGKVHEFARATASSHPAHFTGDDPVSPPTFLTTTFFWEQNVPDSNPWHLVLSLLPEAGVRVNAVAPSLAMHPFLSKVTSEEVLAALVAREAMGRAAEPWEVANVMVFLASDYASYMTGEVVAVSSQQA